MAEKVEQKPRRSWRTTLMGALALMTIGVSAAQNPSILLKPETIATVVTSVGLVVAGDNKKIDEATEGK